MGELEPRGRRKKPSAAMRGARDLYVRGLRGLDRLVAAASPRRAGVGRPTSRAFGAGASRDFEEQELREFVRAMQGHRGAAPSTAAVGRGKGKEDTGAAAASARGRGTTPLERIDEEAAVVHPTS